MADGFGIEFNIDWGTYKWVITWTFTQNGKRIGEPSCICIEGQAVEVRQMAAWIDGRLVQGFELERKISKNPAIASQVLELFKLLLYKGAETSDLMAKAQKILTALPEKKTVDDLIAEHLKSVVETGRKALVDGWNRIDFKPEQVMEMPYTVRVTVPQMWTEEARRRIQAAAKKAGLPIVQLAYEPQCALSYLIDDYVRRGVGLGLRKGSLILVADLGCGTGDFVLYRLTDNLSIHGRLEPVDLASGDLCGSFQVDRLLLKAIEKRETRYWRSKMIKAAGINRDDFERRALRAIEEVKCAFKAGSIRERATIEGVNGKLADFWVTREEYHSALDEVISRITAQMDKFCVKKRPNVIALVGGFAKNEYLKAKLQARYDEEGKTVVVRPTDGKPAGCQPVAMGALLRYGCVEPQKLPTNFGVCKLQDQVADPERHPDCCKIRTEPLPKRVKGKKVDVLTRYEDHAKWVRVSPYDPKINIVEDRLRKVIPIGSTLDKRFELQEEYYLPVKNPRLTPEFVMITRDFEDHARSKDYNGKENSPTWGTWREGVQPWLKIDQPLEKEWLKSAGYKMITSKNGEKSWRVPVRCIIEERGGGLALDMELLEPAGVDEEGAEDFAGKVAKTIRDEIWDCKHSEFIE